MRSKIDAHLREIRFVQSLLPITSIVLETGTFDPHALKNPDVLQHKWLYQRGINYSFANTKAYVLTRDNYTCQHCKGKSKDLRLEVHHLIFRSEQGQEYFIKGRMSTGYAILMDISGKKVDLKPIPKFEKMKRVCARSSWMISQRIMPSFSSSPM